MSGRDALLPAEERRKRARRVCFVLSDCDGVLTDSGVYYGASGDELRRFSVRDGLAVERLRQAGIQCGIVSGEDAPAIRQRAAKLRLPFVRLGVRDKATALPEILAAAGVGVGHTAYIGDDVNDVALMRAIEPEGLLGAPADALPEVAAIVHFRCVAPGGHGAFREFAEWILSLRAGGL